MMLRNKRSLVVGDCALSLTIPPESVKLKD